MNNETSSKFAIAFYNTENFFDVRDDPQKFENEYTPKGTRKWTEQRYENKVWKISSVISEIGIKETGSPPVFIGLAEIENKKVLLDLIQSEHLLEYGYDLIHFESLDERGIDTAVLFRNEWVEPLKTEPIRLIFSKEDQSAAYDYSRDVLYVEFKMGDQLLHLFVAHLPSRRDDNLNADYRNEIMMEIRKRTDVIFDKDQDAQIIIMGDLNGNPNDISSMEILRTQAEMNVKSREFYNPMINMMYKTGSLKHEGRWLLFDQILFSKSFVSTQENTIKYVDAQVYNDNSVKEWDKKFKGSPFRTFVGTKYLGGFSDHFPVYAIINY